MNIEAVILNKCTQSVHLTTDMRLSDPVKEIDVHVRVV